MPVVTAPLGQKVLRIPVDFSDLSVAASSLTVTDPAWLDSTRLTMIEKVVIHKTADFVYAGAEQLYLSLGVEETGVLGAMDQPDALVWPLSMTTGTADEYLGLITNSSVSPGRTIHGIVENALTSPGPTFASFGGTKGPSEQAVYFEDEHVMTRMRAAYLSDTGITIAGGEVITIEWGEFFGDSTAMPANFSKLAKFEGLDDIGGWNDVDLLGFDEFEGASHPRTSSACFLKVFQGERIGVRISVTGTPLEVDAEFVVEADFWPTAGPTRRMAQGPVPFHQSLGSVLKIYGWTKDGAANLDTLVSGTAEILVFYRDIVP